MNPVTPFTSLEELRDLNQELLDDLTEQYRESLEDGDSEKSTNLLIQISEVRSNMSIIDRMGKD